MRCAQFDGAAGLLEQAKLSLDTTLDNENENVEDENGTVSIRLFIARRATTSFKQAKYMR